MVPPIEKNGLKNVPTLMDDRFSNIFLSSGLNENNQKLVENSESVVERRTRLRREEPLFSSDVLGEYFQYSQKQLEKKALKHLKQDYDISTEGLTKNEKGLAYMASIKNLLKRQNLTVWEEGRMNYQEDVKVFLN